MIEKEPEDFDYGVFQPKDDELPVPYEVLERLVGPADLIDNDAIELMHRVVGAKVLAPSNALELDMLWLVTSTAEAIGEVEGHRLRSLAEIAEDERAPYVADIIRDYEDSEIDPLTVFQLEDFRDWYPKPLEAQREAIDAEIRRRVLERVSALYEVPMEDFPQQVPLYSWAVVSFINKKRIAVFKAQQQGQS